MITWQTLVYTGAAQRQDTISTLAGTHSVDARMILSICCAKSHRGMQPERLGACHRATGQGLSGGMQPPAKGLLEWRPIGIVECSEQRQLLC